MVNKYHKFTINEKEYKIKKMGLRDALWVSAQISNIAATPIISLILDFVDSNKKTQKKVITDLNMLIQYKDTLKEHIPTLIKLISENFDLAFEILDKIMEDSVISSKDKDGNLKEDKFSIDDYSMDEIDEIVQILIESIPFNFETGLKKFVKKFPSQGLDQA